MPRTPDAASSIGSKLQSRLKNVKPEVARTEPLWKGPCATGPNGGITFSMLTRFLSDRERFRVHYLEGIKAVERFNHRTDYGTMWHLCEEALAKGICANDVAARGTKEEKDYYVWRDPLTAYCLDLIKKHPLDREQIDHWYRVCETQFPIYVDYWRQHPDMKKRTPLMQEQVFDVPYKLPSGRTVRLRGKFDSVDLIDGGVWLQENKTKGDVDFQEIQRQLTWDLQTMLYLIALQYVDGQQFSPWPTEPIKGVRYNVVRRPLSGGKGTIVRHKPTKSNPQGESWDSYYERLGQVIKESPEHFFSRWNTEITPGDIMRFRVECLNPILENVAHWYDHQSGACDPTEATHGIPPSHWRHPFGAANTIDAYGQTDLDEYLSSKSMAGLRRVNTLFEELT